MKNLRYVGSSDYRELSPEDLRRLGVEDAEATLKFKKGESLTVEDEVADAIMNQVNDMREATDEELVEEEAALEAELGFVPYNPSEHTVKEVSEELANSDEVRRQYILDQERANDNRKGVFAAVGAEWHDVEEVPLEEAPDTSDMDPATEEAMEAAGGHEGSSSTSGTTSTSGPANTSSIA